MKARLGRDADALASYSPIEDGLSVLYSVSLRRTSLFGCRNPEQPSPSGSRRSSPTRSGAALHPLRGGEGAAVGGIDEVLQFQWSPGLEERLDDSAEC